MEKTPAKSGKSVDKKTSRYSLNAKNVMTNLSISLSQPLTVSKHTVYIGRGNGDKLLRNYFEKRGWVILDSSLKYWTRFNLKWVQAPNEIDWTFYHEGLQIVNHISNIMIYGNKCGLISTVREYEAKENRHAKDVSDPSSLHSVNFLPESYRLDITRDDYSQDETQFTNCKNDGLWILKPHAANCGRGVKMVSSIKRFKEDYTRLKTIAYSIKMGKAFTSQHFTPFHKKTIIQKYIEKPLLLDKRKFDIRCYVLIASTNPMVVLFHHGYVRLSITDYNTDRCDDKNEVFTHLTNAAVQKKHPQFEKLKESTIWNMIKFENYLIKEYGMTGPLMDQMYKKMKEILAYTIKAGMNKLEKKVGTFELIGCDILVDDQFKPWLIELNTNPALYVDTIAQEEIIPYVVKNSLDIVLRINENPSRAEELLKNNQVEFKTFTVLINEATKYSMV